MDVFYLHLANMLAYLLALRAMAGCAAHLSPSRHLAAALTGVVHLLCVSLPSGLSPGAPHSSHLPPWLEWLRQVSPAHWMGHPLVQGEFAPVDILRCSSNPLVTENTIIKQVGKK